MTTNKSEQRSVADYTVLKAVQELHRLYKCGDVPGPAQHEVSPDLPPGSRDNYLYFTLTCAINFQRNSPALWSSALRTYSDPDTSFVFHPEEVCQAGHERTKEALSRYRLALQTNRHAAIWVRIFDSLYQNFLSDPRELLAQCSYDVLRIVALVQEQKSLFPYLGGPKLSNYWVFILSQFTDAPLVNTHALSIIPDTHVIQSSVRLGLVPPVLASERSRRFGE